MLSDRMKTIWIPTSIVAIVLLIPQLIFWIKMGASTKSVGIAMFIFLAITTAFFVVWRKKKWISFIGVWLCLAWINWFSIIHEAAEKLVPNAMSLLDTKGPVVDISAEDFWWNSLIFKLGVLALLAVVTALIFVRDKELSKSSRIVD